MRSNEASIDKKVGYLLTKMRKDGPSTPLKGKYGLRGHKIKRTFGLF